VFAESSTKIVQTQFVMNEKKEKPKTPKTKAQG